MFFSNFLVYFHVKQVLFNQFLYCKDGCGRAISIGFGVQAVIGEPVYGRNSHMKAGI